MNWFEGEIAQAINTSKSKQAIFVVYVYGKDEKSSQFLSLINKPEIAKTLGSDSFVAIKIEADSVAYQQFSQIYKQVPVPSLYFIGKQGVPLEIVTEVLDSPNFQQKLNTILEKGGLAVASSSVQTENGCVKPSQEKEALTPEEKIERAKQLVEKKREEKQKEEFEEERQKEIERRKVGQNVQQLKRWQEDQELKQLLEEREKEKRESQAARERVLAQIAQDKAERAAKFSSAQTSTTTTTQQTAPRPINTNISRLQFRMPDGRTSTNDFPSSDTLTTVHNYIRANLNLPFNNYTLSTTFPRREFTENDKNTTLLELGLIPTAVILILPINRGVVTTAQNGGFTGFLWGLLTPIFTVLGYLKTFLFGVGATQGGSSQEGQNKRSAEGSNESRMQPKIRRAGETTVIRRQGNIHRLSNRNDSDDENNTWNGNSTQQM